LIQFVIMGMVVGGFVTIGHRVMSRGQTPEAQATNRTFGLFWLAAAGIDAIIAIFAALDASGVVNPLLIHTLMNAAVVLASVGLWGISYYLAYLYTGDVRWFSRLAMLFGAVAVVNLYLVGVLGPQATLRQTANLVVPDLDYVSLGDVIAAAGLLAIGPLVLVVSVYLALLSKGLGASQRRRVVLFAAALAAWGLAMLSYILAVAGSQSALLLPAFAVCSLASAGCGMLALATPPGRRQWRVGLSHPLWR